MAIEHRAASPATSWRPSRPCLESPPKLPEPPRGRPLGSRQWQMKVWRLHQAHLKDFLAGGGSRGEEMRAPVPPDP